MCARFAWNRPCRIELADWMSFQEYVRMQLEEALGPVNRWYCSQRHGYDVRDPDKLVEHYVRNGGAESFSRRFRIPVPSEHQWMSDVHGMGQSFGN